MPSCGKEQSGGAIISSIADLAIPFSLLIAQRGISSMLKKTNNKSSDKKTTRKKVVGGGNKHEGCLLCHQGQTGGEQQALQEVRNEFQRLSSEIKTLLKKYK